MRSVIQRLPEGFLAALGIRGTGENPRTLLEEVRAVVDLSDYYTTRAWEMVVASTSTGAVNGSAVLTVPQGEAWRVHSMCANAQSTVTTGAFYRFSVGYRSRGLGAVLELGSVNQNVVAAGDNLSVGVLMNGVILPPGSILLARNQAAVAAAFTLSCVACIERLSV